MPAAGCAACEGNGVYMSSIVQVCCDFCGNIFSNRQLYSVQKNRERNNEKYRCVSCKQKAATHFKGTSIHFSYSSAKNRCNNPKNSSFANYGGRGILFLWNSFEDFMKDMLPTYFDGATIDRIDVNGNYCKENCKWSTITEQARNTRRNIHTKETIVEIRKLYAQGIKQTELAKIYGDSQGNISNIVKERIWKNV
jgi:hypothetical protein